MNTITKDTKLSSTIPFKLKDHPGRNYKIFNFKDQFGFVPDTIVISKPKGENKIVLSVVLPNVEQKK